MTRKKRGILKCIKNAKLFEDTGELWLIFQMEPHEWIEQFNLIFYKLSDDFVDFIYTSSLILCLFFLFECMAERFQARCCAAL